MVLRNWPESVLRVRDGKSRLACWIEKLDKRQRIALAISAAATAFVLVFPPWDKTTTLLTPGSPKVTAAAGRHFLFAAPGGGYHSLATGRLVVELLCIATLASLAIFVIGMFPRQRRD